MYIAIQRVPNGRKIERDIQVDQHVGAANPGKARYMRSCEGMEVCLEKRFGARCVRRRGIGVWRANVPENSRVDTTGEAGVAEIGNTPDPVVVDLLVCLQYKRVALTSTVCGSSDGIV